MAKYRKKPVVIDAYQTDKEMIIHTLEGDMKANVGDYIITGVDGERYPCKPDIFEKTYESVESQYSKFSDLSIGDVFSAFNQTFIKFGEAVVGQKLNNQLPNCFNLSKRHYAVLGTSARCYKLRSISEFSLPYIK